MLDLYVQLKRVKLDSGNTLLVFQKLSNALPALWIHLGEVSVLLRFLMLYRRLIFDFSNSLSL